MNTHAMPTSSLICLERSRRATLMRETAPARHATEFRDGMHATATAPSPQASALSLEQGRLLSLPARDLTLRCEAGELWLTRDGDSEDYILGPGDTMVLRRDDQAAVQALRPSRLRLAEAGA